LEYFLLVVCNNCTLRIKWKGDDELDRGEGIAYSGNAMKDITEAAIGSMHSDKPIDPDVLP